MELDAEETVTTTKCVTFQPTITIVRFHDTSTPEERWHTLAERKDFILQARDETKQWIDKGCYEFLLKDVFQDASEESAQAKLDAYVQLPGEDYCRGLERHVCREHGLRRDSFKKGAVRAIVNEGKKRREMPQDRYWHEMGAISRKVSMAATRFARRVGMADALVAQIGEDASKVQRLRMENDPVQKNSITVENPAKEDTQVKEEAALNICVKSRDDSNVKSDQVEHNGSPRSITSVNAWCHGPRESCIGAVDVGMIEL